MVESSLVYRFFSSIGRGIMHLLEGSGLVNMFLTENVNDKRTVEGSIFYRIYFLIRIFIMRIFSALRLNKLFAGSIYKKVILWASLTAVFAPILPTSIIILLSVAGMGSLMLSLACDRRRRLKYSPVNRFIYIYAAVYLFSIFTSVDVKGSLYGGLLTVFFILFAIVIENAVETKTQVKGLIFILCAAGVVVSLYGFYQFMFQDKFGGVWVDTEMFENIFRVYSTLENPNVLGEYFLLVIPLAAAGFFISKNMWLRLYYLGCAAVMSLCLILTYSRGCYIGIIVAAGVFLVLLDRRFILLGVVALLFMPFVLPESIINRFMSIGNMEDSSTSYRVYIWMGTINMLKDYWLCGVGPGQAAYNKVYPFYGYNEISAPHSHNTFLQIMCDTGIVGLVVFIALIYKYYKYLFCTYIKNRSFEERILVISSMASISAFLVQSLFDYTFYNYRVMLLFWIFIGLGIVSANYSNLKE